jgi:hypothetical protein
MAAFTLMGLSLLMSGIGAGASAYGQVKGGREAKRQGALQQQAAESQAELSDYNASVADLQATDATQRGEEEANHYRQGVRTLVGEQRATFAASGVNVDFGSAGEVQQDSAFLGELDALTIRTNAAREAWGYKTQAYDFRKRADITRREGINAAEAGKSAARAGVIGAGTTLLGAGASLLEARYNMGKGRAPRSRLVD